MKARRLSTLECAALAVITCIAMADLYTYSTPDAFLGEALAAQGATPGLIMLAYGVSGAMSTLLGILVLLCQSNPAVTAATPGSKWTVVVGCQLLSVLSSAIIITRKDTAAVIVSRAVHGSATAGYLIYCLILLVELSPKQHLALGIAGVTAGMTAGDSIAPVIGAVVYDRAGFRAAFVSPLVLNSMVLLLTLMVFPLWRYSAANIKRDVLQRSYSSSIMQLPRAGVQHSQGSCSGIDVEVDVPTVRKDCMAKGAAAATRQIHCSAARTAKALQLSVGLPHGSASSSGLISTLVDDDTSGGHGMDLQTKQQTSKHDTQQSYDEVNSSLHMFMQQANVMNVVNDLDEVDNSCIVLGSQLEPQDYTETTDLPNRRDKNPIVSPFVSTGTSNSSSSSSSSCTLQGGNTSVKLDIKSVWNTLTDPVIFGQCLLLLLEQTVRSALTVVLPAAMGTATWLVGVVYIANVLGALLSPFAVDYSISHTPKFPTQILSVTLCAIMGVSCTLSVLFSTNIPVLVISLFAYGASQSAVETLVYVNVAQRLEALRHHTMTHVSMCMYMLAQVAGGSVGSLTGGALQAQTRDVQLATMAAGAGVSSLFGVVLGALSHTRK